jgi:hypothetical protein
MYKEGRPEKSFKTSKKVRKVYVYGANIATILCKMEYVNESDCNKPKQSHSPTHSPTPSLTHSLTHSLIHSLFYSILFTVLLNHVSRWAER